MKTVPKHIKDKCKHMEKLCLEATCLFYEVEKWCEKNGIDTNSEEWRDAVDECGGCGAIIHADEIESLLK